MLLHMSYMSSGRIEYVGRLPDDRVDFASDIAFKSTDDFDLAHSFCGSSPQVRLRPQIVTQPDDDYAIERRIGLAIATTVEPMPVGLAG